MFWVELILVLAIIFLGVRKGGTFLAMAGGVWNVNYDIFLSCYTGRSASYRLF